MTDIVIKSKELQDMMLTSIPAILKDKFSSTYSNPLADIIAEEIKNADGSIRLFVRKIIDDSLTDKLFKDKITNAVISEMIRTSMKNS